MLTQTMIWPFRTGSAVLMSLAVFASIAAAEERLNLQEVGEGVFVHQGKHELPNRENQGEIANIGFIVGDRCVAVVDSGGSLRQGLQLKREIESRTRIPICYVINTHMHPDHVYGNLAFQQPGVTFVGHFKLPQALATRAPFYREMAQRDMGMVLTSDHFIVPSLLVKDELNLDLGARTLHLVAHRTAHTDNDLSVQDSRTKILWLSDLLFIGHLPVVDGSLTGWLGELDRISVWQASKVIPGHGPATADWPGCLEPERAYLTALRSQLRQFLKAGDTLEKALESAGQDLRNGWDLFDDFHRRNVSAGFAELEWEE